MLNVFSAILAGLLIGGLARLFYPGNVDMDWISTILLGIGGSLFAGLFTSRGSRDFNQAGCLASIVGAMALILIGRALGIG
ncbi:GlsB/YeaQ/YmgE family stress response membrane protein [Altericroceibacterium spongiae]|uniref:GlsB/YeaQ/YmgE family stress response membrane protein n=1 Tax=Altericroceibacterium spongiae TaxID=2320269 RepID=A0A420EPH1_9SPHN|nr:GlsB/YeaQ/YmgE family stress response membrane protein [Altericroceibacterium spongiae]RKF22572.1 GlsB/YeaQ/YmgE family stress response membrane protein [Altericroceibacterium spongiae]